MSEDYEPTQEELDDAIIEDTVHCDLCGCGYDIGGNGEGICVNALHGEPLQKQLKLCIDCVARVSLAYEQAMKELDICEHGVCCGDWCEPCNKAYKEAREANP